VSGFKVKSNVRNEDKFTVFYKVFFSACFSPKGGLEPVVQKEK